MIKKKNIILLIAVIIFLLLTLPLYFAVSSRLINTKNSVNKAVADVQISPSPIPTVTATPEPTFSPTPTAIPLKLIFGIGSQAGPAMDYKIVKESPVRMLSSWYNGTSDLEWMRVQQNDLIPRLYKNHFIVHLITWTDLPETDIQTPYGPACGRPYPVGNQVVEDMKQLAQIYNGQGTMYVSLFTEFPTYTCTDNNWTGNENYYNTLKDNYRKIVSEFHKYAPNSKVSLSWGGWIGLYDDTVNQGGKSLIPHFADVIKISDFTSFQAMESDDNTREINNMVSLLGAYGKPVMLSHYKPSNASEAVFDNDMNWLFNESNLRKLKTKGLFAVSLMDSEIIDDSDKSYQIFKNGVIKYAK